MRIGAFATGRVVILLRKLCKAQERLAEIEQKRLEIEQERLHFDQLVWAKAGNRIPGKSNKSLEVGTVDVEELNRQWKLQHPDM